MSTYDTSHIPLEIETGTSLEFSWSSPDADYNPSNGYAATCYLVNASARYVVSGEVNDEDFDFHADASTTGGWTPGTYAYAIQVSKSTDVYTLERGTVKVKAGFGSAADKRSEARKVLEAIDSLLAGKASADAASYSIAGRSLSR